MAGPLNPARGLSQPWADPLRDSERSVLDLASALGQCGWRLAIAESCTGGLLAACCTAVAGSSSWFERGVVTYSNQAKNELLGVPAVLIEQHGAVSEQVAAAMALGLLMRTPADMGVSITGVAGPGGGSADKPVGLVWLGVALRGQQPARTWRLHCPGDRHAVRSLTVRQALWLAKRCTPPP